jgi:hypothetical protein
MAYETTNITLDHKTSVGDPGHFGADTDPIFADIFLLTYLQS